VDLLRQGSTTRLPASWHGDSGARAQVSDAQLRRSDTEKVDWAALTPEARRLYLQNLNEPPRLRLRAPTAARTRRRRRRT
jgi:hypothetical protein